MKKFQIDGLFNWDFAKLTIEPILIPFISLVIDFDLINPKITVNGDYDLSYTFLDEKTFGKGNVE